MGWLLATSFGLRRRSLEALGGRAFEKDPYPLAPSALSVSKSCQCEQGQWWAQCSLGVLSRGSVTGQIQSVHKNLSPAHS